MKDRLLYISLLGFAIGVFFRSLFYISFYVIAPLFFLAFGVFVFSSLLQSEREKRVMFSYAFFFVAVSFGMMRFAVSEYVPTATLRGGENISLKGIIVDEVDVREDHSNLTVQIKDAKNSHGEKLEGNVLVSTDRYAPYQYGDEVLLVGKIKRPENISSNDTQTSFDYVSYLAKDGIYYQMLRPKIELQDSGKGNSIKQILFSIKHAFLSNIKKAISEPESSLLAGLVVGAKQSLGKQLLTDFRTVGVIHIVVLSGYNLTIVAQAMMRVFAFLPEMFSLSLGGIGIILFAIMTGGSATIVRASIMSILVLVAKGTHRDYNITRALLLAGFLMVMQNPHILVFDPSFQLSFLATIALIYLAPIMKKYFLWVPEKFGFQELAVSTISTQLFVLPFLLYSMGTLSIVALPVNLLMLPLIPITMFFGFVIGMVSFISSLLALPFAFITHLLLWYELKVVDIFSKLPFASVTITHFPFWLMTSCYVGYAAFFLSVGTTEKKN